MLSSIDIAAIAEPDNPILVKDFRVLIVDDCRAGTEADERGGACTAAAARAPSDLLSESITDAAGACGLARPVLMPVEADECLGVARAAGVAAPVVVGVVCVVDLVSEVEDCVAAGSAEPADPESSDGACGADSEPSLAEVVGSLGAATVVAERRGDAGRSTASASSVSETPRVDRERSDAGEGVRSVLFGATSTEREPPEC
jgi:hypothetical protein